MISTNNLALFLITYNRKEKLQQTFRQIFAENSPIKNFDITILDNASTDGTSKLIGEYCIKFPNITYIRHKKNIGGNANICRAFEMGASCGKEYFWVLCDDDELDFSNWDEIQNALASNKYEILFTVNHLKRKNLPYKLPILLFWAAFVPACIYRAKQIDEMCLTNMYGTINTWYPQAVPSINILVNKNCDFFIPKKNIVNRISIDDMEGTCLHRGEEISNVHPDLLRMYWHVGYMKALRTVQDKTKKNKLCKQVHFNENFYQSDFRYIKSILDYNRKYRANNMDNYWDIFQSISFLYKLYLIYYIVLGRFFKIDNIRYKRMLENIFSITKDENNSKIITIFGYKLNMRKTDYD